MNKLKHLAKKVMNFSSKKIDPTRTVYCYYYPEVRNIISKTTNHYPHYIYLQSIHPGLDDFHQGFVDSYKSHMKDQISLDSFDYVYPISGASEGIFHILAQISTNNRHKPLYILEGEYEGYEAYGNNLGLVFTKVQEISDLKKLPPGIVFISNPSARDGNIIKNVDIELVAKAGHEIIYDVTYVGITKKHKFDITNPAIKTVLVSLSKPFGIYYYRVGICFTRSEIPTLIANKWFKNILSLKVAENILSEFNASDLYYKYKSYQTRAVNELSKRYRISIKPSDALLLAYIPENSVPIHMKETLKIYKRGKNYRFCLTPFFLSYEKS